MEKPTDELCVGNPLIAIGVLSHSSLTQLTQLLQGYNTLYTFSIIQHHSTLAVPTAAVPLETVQVQLMFLRFDML